MNTLAQNKMLAVVSVNKVDDNHGHAVTLFGFDQNKFQMKNSWLNIERIIEVDAGLPVFSEFKNDPDSFRQIVRQYSPNFSDQDWILSDNGFGFQFSNKE